jgi:hypothetical protein
MENSERVTEEKQLMLDYWKQSGQSKASYCKERNIAYHSFFYWQKKLSIPSTSSKKKFIKLGALPKTLPLAIAEVVYPNGTRIVFHSLPDVFLLKQLAE